MCLAVPGRILSISPPSSTQPLVMGQVDFGGLQREVCLACVPEAVVGTWVLVHAGFALQVLTDADARERRAWMGAE